MDPKNRLYLLESFRNAICHFLGEMMTYVQNDRPVHQFGMVTILEHTFPALVEFLGPENRLSRMPFALSLVDVPRFIYHLSTLKVIFLISIYLIFMLRVSHIFLGHSFRLGFRPCWCRPP